MKNFKIKSIEDDNVNVETWSIKRTVGDPIAVEDSTYLSAIEASFKSRGFPLEIMQVRQMSEHQNQTFW